MKRKDILLLIIAVAIFAVLVYFVLPIAFCRLGYMASIVGSSAAGSDLDTPFSCEVDSDCVGIADTSGVGYGVPGCLNKNLLEREPFKDLKVDESISCKCVEDPNMQLCGVKKMCIIE